MPTSAVGSRSSALTIAAADDSHRSASTIAADKVSCSHVLTVTGYSKTKGLGVGKCISSAAFLVGGHAWSIRFYPVGYNYSSQDYSFFLEPVDYEGDIRAGFTFCLLDQFHEPVPVPSSFRARLMQSNTNTNTFSSETHEPSGFPYFVRRQDLQESPYLKDDTFRIRCEVVVTVVKIHAGVPPPFLAAPSQDLHRYLGDLLESKVGADVTFVVGAAEGKLFAAHRMVLAVRSPVFMAQFFGPMKEDEARQIRIDDMDASVFRAMLHFVYTDTLPPEICCHGGSDRAWMAQHLLVAADRYDLERLKRNCEDVLGSYVDTDTVTTTLVIAEQHGCHALKEGCLKFLRSPGNMNAVMATVGFDDLKTSCPSLVQELLASK